MSKFVPRLMLGVALALALALTLSGTPPAAAGDGDHQKGLATANAVPAKELFGAVKEPAPVSARAIGFYSHGCLAGAVALPVRWAGLAGDAAVAQPQLGAIRR